ncbi:hypothetical protein ACOMHN_058561 [Nucella lapillus]
MAEILNRCLKCKCSLSSPEKTSKLLPCLHTMCEDCIAGRTDVAEKIRRMKEEKEQKKAESADNTKKEKVENALKDKEEEVPKPEERKEDEEQVEETVPDNGQSETSDKTDSVSVAENENQNESKEESAVSESASATAETTSDCEQAKEPEKSDEEKKDEEKPPVDETTSVEPEKEEQHVEEEAPSENSKTPSAGSAETTGQETTAREEDKEEKENENNEVEACDHLENDAQQEESKSVADETSTKNDKAETEEETPVPTAAVPEKQPSDENQPENEVGQGDTSRNEESMELEEGVVEEEEPPPPSPVPLTECPICREPFNHEALIDNVFIRKQAVTPEDGEGSDQKCTGCESNPATSFCLQCDDWLCADCVNAHKRVRMTKDHQLTSLEEALDSKSSSSGPVEVSMQCRVHPKEKMTLFCERCEVLTCRDCQLQQHQEHKYQFLQEAADSYKAKLTGSLSLMKDRRETMKRYQTEIEERLGKVKREKSELQQDILRQAETIVRAVRGAVWGVLSSLHSFTDAAAKRLSREVGDVRDLVGKFDHCISFMDGILEDGFGLPLLYSKNIVESKCRKVYHTHMEPQSLKGQLNIQYRHDVAAVLRSLPQIGAIYVNGSKYPPEKNPPQSQPSNTASSQSSGGSSSSSYRGSGNAPANVVVGAPTQGLPHHMAPQERNLYMQMMMSRQSHPNTVSSQGPTLSLPGSRRVTGGSLGSNRGWSSQQLGLPGAQGGLIGNMLGQGPSSAVAQHPMMTGGSAGRGPAFTPMRLHHRPMEPNHMSSVPPPPPTMVLGAPPPQHRPQHAFSSLPAVYCYEPAPPPLRGPAGQPQYRGAADGHLMNSGGQAAMSGVRRHSNLMDANPDPARPASGGHNTPERPLSSEGAASSMRVKSEPQDTMDCVITSAVFKNKKAALMTGSTLGGVQELQKNLDEVIRGVPLDLGDNLEQINCGDSSLAGTGPLPPPSSSSSLRMSAPSSLPLITPSPANSATPSAGRNHHTPPSSGSNPHAVSSVSHHHPHHSLPVAMTTTTVAAAVVSSSLSSSGEMSCVDGGGGVVASLGGVMMMDSGEGGETSGHQVKGYVTGNSMPGFTLAAVELADPNDDYCATCHQGGDVLCCDKCPRVFHLQCHVPVLATVPSGPFVCTLCEEGLTTESTTSDDGQSVDLLGKRKATTHLTDRDLKVCERVLLELCCHPSSIPFHEPVNRAVPNYYKIITHPMDFSSIKDKLSSGHYDHYTSVEAFLDDCRLVFRNCTVYNSETSEETSEVGKAGNIVQGFFHCLVDRHMPDYATYAQRHQLDSPDAESRLDVERKKRRLTPPPPSSSHHGERQSGSVTPPVH